MRLRRNIFRCGDMVSTAGCIFGNIIRAAYKFFHPTVSGALNQRQGGRR